MSDKNGPTAIGMYAILDRDPEYFIETLPEMSDDELDDLWLMLTTPNPKSDADLNSLGARLVKPHFEKRNRPLPEPVSTKFAITVAAEVPVCLVVKADTLEEAQRLATAMATELPFLKDRGPFAADPSYAPGVRARAIGFKLLDPKDNLVKFSTATCAGCGAQTLKISWGPGWMHCPQCGRQRSGADPE